MQTRRQLIAIQTALHLAALLVVFVGCKKSPEDLLKQAAKAEQTAAEARIAKDPEAAKEAADTAQAVADQLAERVAADSQASEELKSRLKKTQATAQRARDHAEIALEEYELREKITGWKSKAYYKGRDFVITSTLPLLANAAEKAATNGIERLSAIEKPIAEQAWNIVRLVGQRPALTNEAPDWATTASVLREWSTNAPMEFRAFVTLALVLQGSQNLALAEIEAVKPSDLKVTNDFRLYHGGRALVYVMQGWDRLAAPEIEKFGALTASTNGPNGGLEMVGAFHALMAYHYGIEEREFGKMDAELARCIKAWPNNPLAVFLTGERMAANGEWEKAASSLEAQAAGTDDAWLAQRFAQRARDLRDGKGSTKSLILDTGLLLEIAVHAVERSVKASGAPEKINELIESAKAFGKSVLDALPLP